MLEINEAFEILSDPLLRRQYDSARAQPGNTELQAACAQQSKQARAHAEEYPREWSAFEKWLDVLVNDITGARYGRKNIPGFAALPTAEGSVTGTLLIVIGGALGLFIWYHFVRQPFPTLNRNVWQPQEQSLLMNPWKFLGAGNPRMVILGLGICISLGAWLGVTLHRSIAKRFTKSPPPLPQNPQLPCPRCGQILRLPPATKHLRVTCPICKHTFLHRA